MSWFGAAATVVIVAAAVFSVPLAAALALLWSRIARVPWSEIGFGRPRSWAATLAAGIAGGVLFKLVMKAVVMPLLGGPAINPKYHYLAHNTAELPAILAAVIIGAGFGEEIFFRGFLFERLRRLRTPTAAIVALTTLLFSLAHLPDQGVAGAEQAVFTGLAFALLYVATGNLWTSIAVHAAFDVAAVAIIYFDVEARVARLVF